MRFRRDEQRDLSGRGPKRAAVAAEPAAHRQAHPALGLQAGAGNRAVVALTNRVRTPVQRQRESVQRVDGTREVELALLRIDEVLDPDALEEHSAGDPPAVQAALVSGLQRQGGDEESAPRPGTPGDVVKAVLATPAGRQAVGVLRERARTELNSLQPGERAALVGTAIVMTAPVLTTAMSRPDSRSFLLSQVSGRRVGVPGLDGVSARIDFDSDGRPTSGMVYVDVGRFLPPSWGFR